MQVMWSSWELTYKDGILFSFHQLLTVILLFQSPIIMLLILIFQASKEFGADGKNKTLLCADYSDREDYVSNQALNEWCSQWLLAV